MTRKSASTGFWKAPGAWGGGPSSHLEHGSKFTEYELEDSHDDPVCKLSRTSAIVQGGVDV